MNPQRTTWLLLHKPLFYSFENDSLILQEVEKIKTKLILWGMVNFLLWGTFACCLDFHIDC